MPSEVQIPARSERRCEPCKYHKMMNAFYGSRSSWRDWNCMHPEAWKELTKDLTEAQKAVIAAIDSMMQRDGRNIGRTDKQPTWCPLLRESSSPNV